MVLLSYASAAASPLEMFFVSLYWINDPNYYFVIICARLNIGSRSEHDFVIEWNVHKSEFMLSHHFLWYELCVFIPYIRHFWAQK